jgi:CubicO group peptidase (beta-lactamase class C family)
MLAAAGAFAIARPAFADADFQGAARYSAERGGVSLLVMQHGNVLFEDYPDLGGPMRAWELASGTKSFCGIMAAAGVKDGLLRLDENCADTLGEWRVDPRKSRITLRQLLTLTSGIGGGALGRPPPYAEALAAPAAFQPGETFQYGPAPFQIFGEILRRKLSGDPLAYLQQRIFDPIGVRPPRWRRGADGHPHLPSGAALTARDWAAFGAYVLSQPADLDAAAYAANFTPTRANPGYGLTWWLLRPGLVPPSARGAGVGSAPQDFGAYDIRMAAGAGNQRLYLIPAKDLLIVRQAQISMRELRRDRWDDGAFLNFFRALVT